MSNNCLGLYLYCMNEFCKICVTYIPIMMYDVKRFTCAIIIYLHLALLSPISGMDSSSRRAKSSPRGRGRGRRSFAVDPTAMDIDPSSPQVPHTPVQPGVTMAAYIPGISGPLPPPFGAFHQQTSYIPNQSTMYGQFAYNIPPNPHVIHNVHPTPQPTHPNTNQSQENIGSGESEAQSSHGSTRAKTWIEPDGNE